MYTSSFFSSHLLSTSVADVRASGHCVSWVIDHEKWNAYDVWLDDDGACQREFKKKKEWETESN